MSDVKIDKPKNALVELVFQVIDWLIEGVGDDAVIALAETSQPWLKIPLISFFFKAFVKTTARAIDSALSKRIGNVIIRYQGGQAKKDMQDALDDLNEGITQGETKEEHDERLRKAREAMDRIINRNRP